MGQSSESPVRNTANRKTFRGVTTLGLQPVVGEELVDDVRSAQRPIRLPFQGKICVVTTPRATLEASLPLGWYPSARFGAEERALARERERERKRVRERESERK